MDAITIKNLNEYIDYVYKKNKIAQVLDDIILESEVEYNFN